MKYFGYCFLIFSCIRSYYIMYTEGKLMYLSYDITLVYLSAELPVCLMTPPMYIGYVSINTR